MPAPASVHELVERFQANLDAYTRGQYNETQVRREFIDPLFHALGWDVANVQGYAEAYKDVVHEDAIKVAGGTKAPDYSFRIGGQRKFFVEAKKPSVDIRGDVHPAYQLRRYAWSAKLPLSILTDFEELAVYDCRVKPNKADNAAVARVMYFQFPQYLTKWDELAGVFSREAILKGSFDRYVEEKKAKRGTAEVDAAFLAEIERWRELLARNLALRNPGLSQRQLNYAVQQTIDRIIFLRIAEDRGIEPYGSLLSLVNGGQVYERLQLQFRHADARYNSGLFYFQPEKGRTDQPDTLTPGLALDDKVLKDILKSLYYPDSPYEFYVLPADILGQVYEQFLGKVIRLTPGHRAVVEEKPEVRKAGGVYYTPTYIVDYIVRQTVGKLVEGRRPGPQGGVSRLRILDPACGSGSFLLGAYQFLLDWHRDQYVAEDPTKWATGRTPRLYQSQAGEWRLTIDERKRILLNNIYGVDIDPQAVEVTKLSLLLKVLEGESEQTINQQLALFPERVLPDLGRNVRCGNSLIGPDFYDGRQLALLDEEEALRLNVFDWQAEFPEILAAGGFDAVIGNPPYIRIQALKEWAPVEVEFYKERYQAASKGNYDIYVVFVEKGLSLLSDRGRLGFILPHKFFNAKYGQPLRELIAQGQHLADVVHFGDQQVFGGATTYTCLLFLDRQGRKSFNFVKAHDLDAWRRDEPQLEGEVPAAHVTAAEWNFVVGPGAELFERLNGLPVALGDIADIFVGVQTSADDVFVLDLVEEGERLRLWSKALSCEWDFEPELVLPIVSGTDVSRYAVLPRRQYILFPYHVVDESASLIKMDQMRETTPRSAQYLLKNRKRLESRERGKFRGEQWYRFGRNQNIGIQGRRKLCVPRLVEYLYLTFDSDGARVLDNVDVCGITPKSDSSDKDMIYLLGVLNSSLLRWFFPFISAPFRGGWWSANRQFVSQLPIRTIDFANPADVARHDQVVALVERMLDLHQRLAGQGTPHEKTHLQRQIDATDKQIDQLVYELYKLTDDEIRIVEEGTARGR